jgi:hypothetical protein
MSEYLHFRNFPSPSREEEAKLAEQLEAVITTDLKGDVFRMLGNFQRILADNRQRGRWEEIFNKLKTLFLCGRDALVDGPMIGVPIAIRDSDYFRHTARLVGNDRSALAAVEWMASCWNATFADTGLWMGKTFEPVAYQTFAGLCDHDPRMVAGYSAATARIGRNFFRQPSNPDLLQSLGIPVLTKVWQLKPRPVDLSAAGFLGTLLAMNLEKEEKIPYSMTGGIFLAQPGLSVVPEMRGKSVYQLNYRWPALEPAYPMTRLVDELVQIADGVYLGQLVMATDHYSLGPLRAAFPGLAAAGWDIGESYRPGLAEVDYGYQNNGFFLMIDTELAREAYADGAFPQLRPRPGESGYALLGYDRSPGLAATVLSRPISGGSVAAGEGTEWISGWQKDSALTEKFTQFCLEPSPRGDDGDVRELLRPGESILQMLQRIQQEIAKGSAGDDHLRHFEKLNRLFRGGIAPRIANGMFQGQGKGFNSRFDAPEKVLWYGKEEPCRNFDYYHGATLNLHLGFADTLRQGIDSKVEPDRIFPSGLACLMRSDPGGPNLLDAVWASIGRFIFPWAGKSFERISGRKLSMLLDESSDLDDRYPGRVAELRTHPASWPHYDLVKKNRARYWQKEGAYAPHLGSGSWDSGMSAGDRAFWDQEAREHWIFGNNIQDSRILAGDRMMRMLDMNYHPPLPSLQRLADEGPSPFVRQGYIFLGVSGRESILPMNKSGDRKKRVFQFHYRYPMIGGPAPIGTCLDELVEIAEGLFLGQLIYSTDLLQPFHSSVDPADYKYQLFGYFLLLDNTWQRHRLAIGFDVNTA